MNEIDLGPIRVVVTPIPSGPSQPSDSMRMTTLTVEADAVREGLTRPNELPSGLAFLDANLVTSPVRMLVATYYDEETSRSVTLAQTPVVSLKSAGSEKPTLFTVGEDLKEVRVGQGSGAQVTISSSPAWQGARSGVVWLVGENVYQLIGRGTTEAELTQIAASV